MEIQELLKLYAVHPQVAAANSLLKDNTSRNIFFKGLNGSGAAMTIASLHLKRGGAVYVSSMIWKRPAISITIWYNF